MSNDDQFSQAGDVLKTIFDRLLSEDAAGYTRFFSGWEKIAGAQTAMHVYPRDIINNVLILETDHPGWSQQIRMRQEGLLKIIRGKYPELNIKRIRVVIGDSHNLMGKTEKIQSIPAEPSKQKSEQYSEGDESFFNLLEIMRHRGDS